MPLLPLPQSSMTFSFVLAIQAVARLSSSICVAASSDFGYLVYAKRTAEQSPRTAPFVSARKHAETKHLASQRIEGKCSKYDSTGENGQIIRQEA